MKVTRRDLLAGAAGAVALGTTAQAQAPAPADPSKVRGKPPRATGQRAAGEKVQRLVRGATSSGTPHQDLMGIITPSDLHFERHHGGVPEIDPATYSLLIHGMVDRPMVFTLADLKRFPSVSRIHFLECSGNLGRTAGPETTPGTARRTHEHERMDRRAAGDAAQGSGRAGQGEVAAGRRHRCRRAHAQRAHREGARRRARRLRAERRADSSGAGLSRAPVPARLGRQRQREVAAAHRGVGPAVHDARRDVEVHRALRQRHLAHVQLPHGRALAHHLSRLSGDAHAGLGRDQRHRLDRRRQDSRGWT